MSRTRVVYFSPTHTTDAIVREVVRGMAGYDEESLGDVEVCDLTSPQGRSHDRVQLAGDDLLVIGFPVHYGRVPAVLKDALLETVGEDGTPVVMIAVFGNRDYEDSLLEMGELMALQGFMPVAAAAFIGEHSFTDTIATARPDAQDLQLAYGFGKQAFAQICTDRAADRQPREMAIPIPGDKPFSAIPAIPWTTLVDDGCTLCGSCAGVCPMGAIDPVDVAVVSSDCIGCAACVKSCVQHARSLPEPIIGPIIQMLTAKAKDRKEPVTFLKDE